MTVSTAFAILPTAAFAAALLGGCASGDTKATQTPAAVAVPVPPAASETPKEAERETDPPAPSTSPLFSTRPSSSQTDQLSTPPFVARSAVVYQGSDKAAFGLFDGDTIKFFESVVTCEEGIAASAPPHVTVTMKWEAGEKLTFHQVSVKNGVMTGYRGSLEVVSAAKKKGVKGKIRILPKDDYNLKGGEVDAVWCGATP